MDQSLDRGKITAITLSILTLVAVGVVLKYAQSVVLPLVVAWLLSYILGPVVNFLTQRRVPTGLAVFSVLFLLLGISYLGAVFLYSRVSVFAAAYPIYVERLTDLIGALTDRLNLPYNPFSEINWGQEVGGYLVGFSGSLFAFMSKLIMVFIFLIFLLMGKPYIRYKIAKAFSPEYAGQVTHIQSSIATQIGRYLSVQFLVSFTTGILIWLALTIIGVDFAVTWAALAFFLNFIPTIGSILASVPPILLAWVQFYPSLLPGVITLIAVFAIQMVMGNGVTPKIMGDRLNLSPVVVLLSLVFWGWLWGAVGALLSIPIASAIKIVCEHIPPLQPISIMMGSGRGYQDEFSD